MLKNFALNAIVAFSTVSLTVSGSNAQAGGAMKLWQTPSYFRGFVISPNVSIAQEDIQFVKSTGATLAYLATDGFRRPVAPYDEDTANIQALDERVGYCHAAGIHYAIAVRQGPGRYDVSNEGTGQDPPSTIWYDSLQQRIYGSMLREITARYCSDTLCVGITPTVEPNPFFDSLCCLDTTQYDYYATRNGVDLTALTQLWVDSIRSASPDIPILIQGPAYSNPTLFCLVPIINDPNIVYEFHDYHPTQYTEAADTAQVAYPGAYLDVVNGMIEIAQFNKTFIEDSLFIYVSQIEQETHAPIIMGEFGMTYEHSGGPQFLADVSSVAIAKGWHFTYFDYWRRPAGSVDASFDYRDWDSGYWTNILISLQQGSEAVMAFADFSSTLRISQGCQQGELCIEWPAAADRTINAKIYDLVGRAIKSLDFTNTSFTFSTTDLISGTYIIVLSSGGSRVSALFSTFQ